MIPFRRRPREESHPGVGAELEETTLDVAPGEYEVVSGILGSEEPTELSLADCQIVADAVTHQGMRSRQSTFALLLDAELEKTLATPSRPSAPMPLHADAPRWDARPTPVPAARELLVAKPTPPPRPATRTRRRLLPVVTFLVAAAVAGGLLQAEVQNGRLTRMLGRVTSFVAR
jgi:hypothetical protein